jgi:hypothetical protein
VIQLIPDNIERTFTALASLGCRSTREHLSRRFMTTCQSVSSRCLR